MIFARQGMLLDSALPDGLLRGGRPLLGVCPFLCRVEFLLTSRRSDTKSR
jgi:hypothetical protein